jgi:hypothetical protein
MREDYTGNKSFKDFAPPVPDIVGTVVGVTASVMIGGIPGAYAGSVVTLALSRVIKEFSERWLGQRERVRVDAVVDFACRKIESNFVAGKELREDDFFINPADGRSAAEEITEGVLVIAQREYEERKLPFYGNLLGNLAFTSSYDRPYCNLLLRIAEALSYRQLCLLHVIHNNKSLNLQHRSLRNHERDVSREQLGVLQELVDVYQRGLIIDNSNTAWLSVSDATVGGSLVELGTALYDLMELSKIRAVDVQETAVLFS